MKVCASGLTQWCVCVWDWTFSVRYVGEHNMLLKQCACSVHTVCARVCDRECVCVTERERERERERYCVYVCVRVCVHTICYWRRVHTVDVHHIYILQYNNLIYMWNVNTHTHTHTWLSWIAVECVCAWVVKWCLVCTRHEVWTTM